MQFEVSSQSHGITDVPGFMASGVACDIRGKGNGQLDLGILYSSTPCQIAGVFTRNRVRAAPVQYDQKLLESGKPAFGVVANSGNANACTATKGFENTTRMAELTESLLDLQAGSVWVCSTGRIGRQLPMQSVEKGISDASQQLTRESSGGDRFASCILTSDTREKKITGRIVLPDDRAVTIASVAKGAGMIRPDMATMLAFLATDLEISNEMLQRELQRAVDPTFNAITVDGDMSTNDTVLLLANGASGVNWEKENEDFRQAFRQGLLQVCECLAKLIVGDGEKISKVVTLKIEQAETEAEARQVGYAVAHSPLVKASWAGSDPNWGRVIAAVGYSGVDVEENRLSMHYDEVSVFENGLPVDANLGDWKAIVGRQTFTITLKLGRGESGATLIASDLTPEYLEFNMKE